jgi:hypothetical protein
LLSSKKPAFLVSSSQLPRACACPFWLYINFPHSFIRERIKSLSQGTTLLRHNIKRGVGAFSIIALTACHSSRKDAQNPLPVIFPDAAKALGPFVIQLEKSRDSSVLSAARVKVEQDADQRHVTVQIKMLHSQEQVTVSFVNQNPTAQDSFVEGEAQDNEGSLGPDRCLSSNAMNSALRTERRTLPLQDAAALFHIPLPRSIHEASSLQVSGVGDAWSINDNDLVWNPKKATSTRIALSWTRDQTPEIRYPLQTRTPPQDLKARRIDPNSETNIDVEWADGFVTVEAADVKAGSWLELQYDIPASETSFLVPQTPAFGNMNILSFQESCPRESFLLERDDLSWDCPPSHGALWAASYSYRQPNDAWDFNDWPELAKQTPSSVLAFADAGEKLDVEVEAKGRLIPKIPPEASRVCLRATWSSDLPRQSMPVTTR